MAEDWIGALRECDTVEKFNEFALALARERMGRDAKDTGFARAVAAEAKKRGYAYIGDKESGCYTDLTPEEHAAVMAELKRREHREHFKRFVKKAKRTKVPMVKAAWEQWAYSGGIDNLGAILILDNRKRVGNKYIYEFDKVPKDVFLRLFGNGAKDTLENIFRMFGEQTEAEERNWHEAI